MGLDITDTQITLIEENVDNFIRVFLSVSFITVAVITSLVGISWRSIRHVQGCQ